MDNLRFQLWNLNVHLLGVLAYPESGPLSKYMQFCIKGLYIDYYSSYKLDICSVLWFVKNSKILFYGVSLLFSFLFNIESSKIFCVFYIFIILFMLCFRQEKCCLATEWLMQTSMTDMFSPVHKKVNITYYTTCKLFNTWHKAFSAFWVGIFICLVWTYNLPLLFFLLEWGPVSDWDWGETI